MRTKKVMLFLIIFFILSCNKNDSSNSSNIDSNKTLKKCSEKIRYNFEIFDNTTLTSDLEYGSNKNQANNNVSLKMDLYQPFNDYQKSRPIIIFAHGGSFISGSKSNVSSVSEFLARSGFVVAAINYRLIPIDGSINITNNIFKQAVLDGIHDMKASIRYIVKNSSEFKIDTNKIFIGGYSAGAIISLHLAYITSIDELISAGEKDLANYLKNNGGLAGNSGNLEYDSYKIIGVINISGSLFSTKFLNSSEPVLFSVHGTNDKIVPFKSGKINNRDIITYGSYEIHEKAVNAKIINNLQSIISGDHYVFKEGVEASKCENCRDNIRSLICGQL